MTKLKDNVRLKKLNSLQDKVVDIAEEASFNGAFLISMGIGKSFIMFKILSRMLDKGILNKGDEIWIQAEEVKVRKITYMEHELPKFKKLFGKDLKELLNIKIISYNIGPKYLEQCKEGKKDLPKVILQDEISSLSL